jgi:hypothetical protein
MWFRSVGGEGKDSASASDMAQLTWWRSERGRECGDYVAPSFSWASVNCNKSAWFQASGSGVALACIGALSKELAGVGGTEYGRISGAGMILRGPLIACVIDGSGIYRPIVELTWEVRRVIRTEGVWFDCPVGQVVLPGGELTIQRYNESTEQFGKTAVHVLLLVLEKQSETRDRIQGLILGRHSDGVGFQRLGLIELRSRGDESKIPVDYSMHAKDFQAWVEEVRLC